MKSKRVNHGGTEYEIKAVPADDGWKAEVFIKGNRICADAWFSRDDLHDYSAFGNQVEDILLGVLEDEIKSERPGELNMPMSALAGPWGSKPR
jgi:hypothetical protein